MECELLGERDVFRIDAGRHFDRVEGRSGSVDGFLDSVKGIGVDYQAKLLLRFAGHERNGVARGITVATRVVGDRPVALLGYVGNG